MEGGKAFLGACELQGTWHDGSLYHSTLPERKGPYPRSRKEELEVSERLSSWLWVRLFLET